MRVHLFTLIFLSVMLSPVFSQAPEPVQAEKTEEAAQPDTAKETAVPEEPAETASILSLKEAAFCGGVEDREPISKETKFSSDIETIYFWTNVINGNDEASVEHVWIYNDVEMARVLLPAKYARNRVWSSKTLLPEWKGEWKVLIIAESDTLGEHTCIIE